MALDERGLGIDAVPEALLVIITAAKGWPARGGRGIGYSFWM